MRNSLSPPRAPLLKASLNDALRSEQGDVLLTFFHSTNAIQYLLIQPGMGRVDPGHLAGVQGARTGIVRLEDT